MPKSGASSAFSPSVTMMNVRSAKLKKISHVMVSMAAAIGIFLACLVAQSRWEAKIHSLFELPLGATVGAVLGVVLVGIIPK